MLARKRVQLDAFLLMYRRLLALITFLNDKTIQVFSSDLFHSLNNEIVLLKINKDFG